MKKVLAFLLAALMVAAMFAGCGSDKTETPTAAAAGSAGLASSGFSAAADQHARRMRQAFEQLPLEQDVDLLRNILYSGVWTRFVHAQQQLQEV